MSPHDSIPAKPPPSDLRPPRRRGALLGLASAAALGGLGLAWWHRQALEQPELVTPALWSVVLATPQGQNLQLADLRGRPLLINFWATWCPPCIEELPLLSRFYQENAAKSWQMLGIAVDQREAVNRFLAQSPVSFPVALAGFAGIELSKTLGNLSGALPFTVVLAGSGAVAHRKMGRITSADLSAWSALR